VGGGTMLSREDGGSPQDRNLNLHFREDPKSRIPVNLTGFLSF